jgi:hypothetical protein
MFLSFTPTHVAPAPAHRLYSCRCSAPVDARTFALDDSENGMPTNQSVFIRGYRITPRQSLIERIFAGAVKISDIISLNPSDVAEGKSIPGTTTVRQWFPRLSGNNSGAPPSRLAETVAIESFPNVSEVGDASLRLVTPG